MIAGVIPGTNILLPPLVMMVLLSLMLLGIAWWLGRKQLAAQLRELKNKAPKKRTVKAKTTIKTVKKRKGTSKKTSPKQA